MGTMLATPANVQYIFDLRDKIYIRLREPACRSTKYMTISTSRTIYLSILTLSRTVIVAQAVLNYGHLLYFLHKNK